MLLKVKIDKMVKSGAFLSESKMRNTNLVTGAGGGGSMALRLHLRHRLTYWNYWAWISPEPRFLSCSGGGPSFGRPKICT